MASLVYKKCLNENTPMFKPYESFSRYSVYNEAIFPKIAREYFIWETPNIYH